jgi:hypothetical protein
MHAVMLLIVAHAVVAGLIHRSLSGRWGFGRVGRFLIYHRCTNVCSMASSRRPAVVTGSTRCHVAGENWFGHLQMHAALKKFQHLRLWWCCSERVWTVWCWSCGIGSMVHANVF